MWIFCSHLFHNESRISRGSRHNQRRWIQCQSPEAREAMNWILQTMDIRRGIQDREPNIWPHVWAVKKAEPQAFLWKLCSLILDFYNIQFFNYKCLIKITYVCSWIVSSRSLRRYEDPLFLETRGSAATTTFLCIPLHTVSFSTRSVKG